MKNALIIIPTYNEKDNIEPVTKSIKAVAKKLHSYALYILIMDDNSPDGTSNIVRTLQKQYKNIELVNGTKTGLGAAYIRGLKFALNNYKFDVCILMDADLSHDPRDIPKLLKTIDNGADYAIGARYLVTSELDPNWPISRIWMSKIANLVARQLVGIDSSISDLTGGFKAIRRSALEQIDLDKLGAAGYVFQVSLLHAFLKAGFVVKEVPIRFQNRTAGTSKLRSRDIVEFIYQAYKLNPAAPIQKFVRFSLVGSIGAIINITVLVILVSKLKLYTLLSNSIAIEVSIISNFFLNHVYTFKRYGAFNPRKIAHQSKLTHRFLRFNVGSLGGAAINFSVFSLLVKLFNVEYVFAEVLAIFFTLSWNYYVSTRFVWKDIDKD